MARKYISIFFLTLLAGILIFCVYMMIQLYKDKEASEQQESVLQKTDTADTVTSVPVPTKAAVKENIPDFLSPTPTVSPTPVPVRDYSAEFYMTRISEEILARISGKSYPEGASISIDDLRWCHVLHYGFDGEIHEGELIVNKEIAHDILEIFRELFDIKYEIEKIRLIDEYNAEDEASMEDNNSSAFCYRTIAESTTLSNHAKGLAIDINPLYNPYVYTRKDGSLFLQPENAGEYVDRDREDSRYIRKDDVCYNIFIAHGFTWGGDWSSKKDYQHFEKEPD